MHNKFICWVLTSFIATLAASAQTCVPPPSGLISWWPGEGDASDQAGLNNGTLVNGTSFAPGEDGQAFNFNGQDQYVQVPDSSSLRPASVTLECWINPSTSDFSGNFISKPVGSGNNDSYVLWISKVNLSGSIFYYLNGCIGTGTTSAPVLSHQFFSSPGNWSHIAYTFDAASGTQELYINGFNWNGDTTTVKIGYDTHPVLMGTEFDSGSPDFPFNGEIDEASIYNRALTQAEIESIWQAGPAGKCPLKVNPPAIVTQPAGLSVYQGYNATISVGTSGSAPLNYQWQFNTTNIAGATNAILTLTNVSVTEAGSYTVTVTNAEGTTNSAPAVLTVQTCDPVPSGLISWWPGDGSAYDETGTNNGVFVNGATMAPGLVGQAFAFDGQSQYVEIPDSPSLHPSSLTMECWMNVSGYENGDLQMICCKLLGTNGYSFWVGFQYPYLDGVIASTTNSAYVNEFDLSFAYNTWYQVAYTYDSVAQTQKLYLNGSLFASGPGSVTISYDTNSILIGAGANGSDSFGGEIDEVSIYNRALTASEILGLYTAGFDGKCSLPPVPPLMEVQPQNQLAAVGSTATISAQADGSPPLIYTWSHGGTNFAPSTNRFLVLTNVQLTDAGTYAVVITNEEGTTTSFNAVLTVGFAPSITNQPQNVEVVPGTNVSFNVGAEGNLPFAYQWYFDGQSLASQTNSVLTVDDVQSANAGSYTVVVTNAFGSATSSVALLTVDTPPSGFLFQPQSQTVAAGSTATFSFAVEGAAPASNSITSGTLQLWLRGDIGVVTNSAGQVSEWDDQSSNSNNATQGTTSMQPLLASSYLPGANPIVRFNGISDFYDGDILNGSANVNLPNAFTAFAVYDITAYNNSYPSIIWDMGTAGSYYSDVAYGEQGDLQASVGNTGNPEFSSVDAYDDEYDYFAPFLIPTNTYRIRIDRLDANLDADEIFDITTDSSTNFSVSTPYTVVPAGGYYIGGVDAGYFSVSALNFAGDIGEVMIYSGYLNETDRQKVASYLQYKYFQGGVSSGNLSYQWQLNGTNIAGATNESLTLADVQPGDDGEYTVVVSNLAGSIVSSNATLTVQTAPAILTQPANQIVPVGKSGTFAVGVGGIPPFNYQWFFNGEILEGQTNATLTIANVQASDVGSYTVAVGNAYGPLTSSPAVLQLSCAGYALDFNNSQAYISITTTGSLTGTFTAELWAMPMNPTSPLGLMGSREPKDESFDFKFEYGSLFHGDVGNGISWIYNSLDAPYSYSVSNWYHIAYVVTPNNYTIFINGQMQGSGSYSSNAPLLFDTNHHLTIGFTGSGSEFMNGLIDEVRVWNVARTQAQIQGDMHCELTGTEPGLEGYWRFDEGSGTSTADSSGFGFTGTLLGGPIWVPSTAPITNISDTAPAIVAQPHNLTNSQGSVATFDLQAGGTVPISYQWYFDGYPLAGETNSALGIPVVGEGNAGSYFCVVSNPVGTNITDTATMTVPSVPFGFGGGSGGIQMSNGSAVLQLTNYTSQAEVVIDASTNLIQWVPIYTNPSGYGQTQFIDTNASNYPQRFYRAVTPGSQ